MPHYADPICTECKQLADKLVMMIKTVSFARLSRPNNAIKKRVKSWLCPTCLEADPDWHLPPYSGPGHTSTSQERIKARREES